MSSLLNNFSCVFLSAQSNFNSWWFPAATITLFHHFIMLKTLRWRLILIEIT